MRCIGCGCTDNRACVGGCSWFSELPPKCSACVEAGILSLFDHAIHRIVASSPRRDEAGLILLATGRRFACR